MSVACVFTCTFGVHLIHVGAGYVVILAIRVIQNLNKENDDSGLRSLFL